MPLKVRFLRKCHTEKRRGRRIIKTKQWKSRRHRRCIERRSLFANSISNLYTKRLSPNSYQESVRYTSVALCAVGTSVTLRLPPSLRDSVCLLYKPFSLTLHISEEPLLCYVLRSLLTLSAKVGVKHDLFYIFLHKVYLYAHYYKVCVLKYIKIGVVRLRYYFPFYYLCKIE